MLDLRVAELVMELSERDERDQEAVENSGSRPSGYFRVERVTECLCAHAAILHIDLEHPR